MNATTLRSMFDVDHNREDARQRCARRFLAGGWRTEQHNALSKLMTIYSFNQGTLLANITKQAILKTLANGGNSGTRPRINGKPVHLVPLSVQTQSALVLDTKCYALPATEENLRGTTTCLDSVSGRLREPHIIGGVITPPSKEFATWEEFQDQDKQEYLFGEEYIGCEREMTEEEIKAYHKEVYPTIPTYVMPIKKLIGPGPVAVAISALQQVQTMQRALTKTVACPLPHFNLPKHTNRPRYNVVPLKWYLPHNHGYEIVPLPSTPDPQLTSAYKPFTPTGTARLPENVHKFFEGLKVDQTLPSKHHPFGTATLRLVYMNGNWKLVKSARIDGDPRSLPLSLGKVFKTKRGKLHVDVFFETDYYKYGKEEEVTAGVNLKTAHDICVVADKRLRNSPHWVVGWASWLARLHAVCMAQGVGLSSTFGLPPWKHVPLPEPNWVKEEEKDSLTLIVGSEPWRIGEEKDRKQREVESRKYKPEAPVEDETDPDEPSAAEMLVDIAEEEAKSKTKERTTGTRTGRQGREQ